MSRWRASGIHFLISLFVAIAAAAIVILVMYPHPYTASTGVGRILVILVSVDVTLGPLITLIIFKYGKPGLKFDLSVIGILQVAALIYGLTIISQARPVFITFVKDRFELVQANAIEDEAFVEASPPFNSKPWTGPMLVGTRMPEDADAQDKILMSALGGGPDIHAMPMFYVPYESQKSQVLARAKPLTDLRGRTEDADNVVTNWLEGEQKNAKDFAYYPFKARAGFHTLIINQDAEPVGILKIDPW